MDEDWDRWKQADRKIHSQLTTATRASVLATPFLAIDTLTPPYKVGLWRIASWASFTDRANLYSERLAIVDQAGTYTYAELIEISSRVAAALLGGRGDLAQERVAFLVSPGFAWAAVLWGIWRAGGVAVPLPMNTPSPELQYFLDDAQPVAAVYDHIGLSVLKPLASAADIQHWNYAKMLRADAVQLPRIDSDRRAMILYTSGTTSRPKGVVTTHANIAAQVTTLIEAWEWSQNDRILLCLPLHHVHGIINVVSCALWSGAVCEMLPRFDAEEVWDRIARGELGRYLWECRQFT